MSDHENPFTTVAGSGAVAENNEAYEQGGVNVHTIEEVMKELQRLGVDTGTVDPTTITNMEILDLVRFDLPSGKHVSVVRSGGDGSEVYSVRKL